MNAYNAEDRRKYNYALLARGIRRLTATIHRAAIDGGTQELIDTALEQLEGRVWVMSFHDPASSVLIRDQDVYSDGRPATTTIDWGDGYATIVHLPDALADRESAAETDELAEEMWPEGPQPTDHRGARPRGKERRRMSVTPNDHVVAPDDVVAAARELIRTEGDGCVVGISELLEELSDRFGDRFPVSPETHNVLNLIMTLWNDPHIDQPLDGFLEFGWNAKGFDHDRVPATGLKAVLRCDSQINSATEEGSTS